MIYLTIYYITVKCCVQHFLPTKAIIPILLPIYRENVLPFPTLVDIKRLIWYNDCVCVLRIPYILNF